MTDAPFDWMMAIDDRILHTLNREGPMRLNTLQEELERYHDGSLKRDGFVLFRAFALRKRGLVKLEVGRFSLSRRGRRYLDGDISRTTGRYESPDGRMEPRTPKSND